MNESHLRAGLYLVLGLALLPWGCQTATGGGGGGDGEAVEDPLPEYQLGDNPELDADVAAITQADNEAVDCFGGTVDFTDEEVLEDLKSGYVTEAGDDVPAFEVWVDELVPVEQSKRDQICDTELEQDADLDAALQRIVDAEDRADGCRGEEATATLDDALLNVKAAFFGAGRAATDLVDFATALAAEAEGEADEVCAG